MPRLRDLLRQIVPRSLRNWARSPSRSLQRAWDALLHATGADATLELRPGWHLICHPAVARAIERPQRNDPAQIRELNGFITACRPGMLLLDLGAHFGLFSFAALHFGGPAARAVAVDPSPDAVGMLALGARLNGVTQRLTLVQAAVGEQSGWQEMLPVGVIADGYYITPEADRVRRDLVRVRVVTVDELADAFGFRPTHLKIDVEGAEGSVLRGARRTLSTDPAPTIFLELHNDMVRRAGADPLDTVAELEQLGYALQTPEGAAMAREAAVAPPIVRLIASRPSNSRP
jgi:FkbM family methyltransferase